MVVARILRERSFCSLAPALRDVPPKAKAERKLYYRYPPNMSPLIGSLIWKYPAAVSKKKSD
jgi:hypothetical protein